VLKELMAQQERQEQLETWEIPVQKVPQALKVLMARPVLQE
jgi:hypothetical protein